MARDMISTMTEEQAKIEGQVGETFVTSLAGLSGSGATGAATASLISGGIGWLKRDKANKAAGGAAAITFTKNRYGVIGLTTDGRVILYRAKASSKGYEIEEKVGQWPRDQITLTVETLRTVFKFSLNSPVLDQPIELEITRYSMEDVVSQFAAAFGASVQ